MTKEIPLTGKNGSGRSALVDDADFIWLNQYQWRFGSHGYAVRYAGNGKYMLMHREILGLEETTILGDHINHNKLDNRRSNLRETDHSGNARNARGMPNATSVFKGVNFDRQTQRWRAEIDGPNGRFKLGRFDSELDAAQAYNEAAIKYHGEFACLNDLNQPLSNSVARPKRIPKSLFIGVYFRRGRWYALIKARGKNVYLGSFDSEEEAARYRDEYVKQKNLPHKLNFPD